MTRQERAARAQRLLEDELVKETLAEMERRAIEEFVTSTKWWWGDKRRRIAAEHIREVREFRHRLEVAAASGPVERIKKTII